MVVRGARKPFPRKLEDEKWLAWGRAQGGRFLQAIFVVDPEASVGSFTPLPRLWVSFLNFRLWVWL